MQAKLERDIRVLKIYAVTSTLLFGALTMTAFSAQEKKQKFNEIDVERINIVESDGKLRMVISNEARQHPGIVNGKIIPRNGPRPPGILFFDQSGDEMGGLIFGENGGKGHFGSFTWDKVQNDQTIRIGHLEGNNGAYEAGMQVWQRTDVPLDVVNAKYEAASKLSDTLMRKAAIRALTDSGFFGANRLFIGKQRDNSTILVMADVDGNPRIRMQVLPNGTPRLDFLDATGKATYSVPVGH